MCRLRNIALESVTDGQTDRRTDGQTDGQTDDGQSDPYVSLCFAGDTKTKILDQVPFWGPMGSKLDHNCTCTQEKVS